MNKHNCTNCGKFSSEKNNVCEQCLKVIKTAYYNEGWMIGRTETLENINKTHVGKNKVAVCMTIIIPVLYALGMYIGRITG